LRTTTNLFLNNTHVSFPHLLSDSSYPHPAVTDPHFPQCVCQWEFVLKTVQLLL
jgi:hypothetical protein